VRQHGERTADKEQILRDLLWLRHQLNSIAGTPAVTGAWRLAADVVPVLEPVWGIVGLASAEVEAVGFLREYGRLGAAPIAGVNAAVTQHAALTFGALELTAPSRREVWDAMERPVQALIDSVDVGSEDVGQPGTLRPRYSPRLDAGLLTDWLHEDEVVPVLRRILRAWCEIARHATGDRRDVAELLLAAAQLARGAALDGDRTPYGGSSTAGLAFRRLNPAWTVPWRRCSPTAGGVLPLTETSTPPRTRSQTCASGPAACARRPSTSTGCTGRYGRRNCADHRSRCYRIRSSLSATLARQLTSWPAPTTTTQRPL
jgi:hypothetical protein